MGKFLKDSKVLVTGADGFIGSHLVEALVNYGAEVRALNFYNSWNSKGWLGDIDKNIFESIDITSGDIRDGEFLRRIAEDREYVFHLSSLIGIPYSYDAPRSYLETNVYGALNVLEACKVASNLRCLVHVSTSEVYGSARTVPITESHPLVGQSPYSASKLGADHLAESFYRSFGLPVVIARPFNTYGPRQTARAVIPVIISQILSGAEYLKLGSLTPTRDFNYVTDTVSGMIALAGCRGALGRVVNIGSGTEISIEDAAKLIMNVCGIEIPIVSESIRIRPEKSEVNRLVACNALIRELTNWHSKVTFEDGIRATVDWIRGHMSEFDPDKYGV